MVCKQCGSYCEPDAKSCSVCGTPLFEQTAPDAQIQSQDTQSDRSNWGFVRSPRWPKPNFDLYAVEEPPQPDAQPPQPEVASMQPAYDDAEEYDSAQTQEYDDAYAPGQFQQQPVQRPGQGFRPPQRFDPQPTRDSNPYGNVQTIGSVGDYDAPYQSGFGRAPQHATVYNVDDTEDEYAPPARMRTPAPKPKAAQGNLRRSPSSRRKASSRMLGGNAILLGAGAVLVVLLLVLGGVLINRNYGGLGGFFRNVFGGSPILKDPLVSEGKNDRGEDCYIITVYARKGNTVTLRIGEEEMSGAIGSSNQKVLRIPKNRFLPQEAVEGETADLVPDVHITTAEGEVFKLDIKPITVQVPSLTFALTAPAGGSIAVGKPNVKFEGTVTEGASVTVEGQPLTVNPDGTFSGEYALPDIGMHTLTIEARKNGYQIAKQTVQVDYTNADAHIELTKSSLRAADGETATVKGTIDAGATLAVKGPEGVTVGTPSVNTATGFFSFTVQMPAIGHYTLEATVTKDGSSTTAPIIVERAPVYETYTAAVYKMDYDRMSKEPQHKAAYKCIGKVSEILQSEPYYIAKLTTDKGDILFEYHGSAATVELNDSKTYNVFGDYVGIDADTNLPAVYGWFITKG